MSAPGVIEQLRAARLRQGLTQADVADLAGYAMGTISKAEQGRVIPGVQVVADWAMVLGYRLELREDK